LFVRDAYLNLVRKRKLFLDAVLTVGRRFSGVSSAIYILYLYIIYIYILDRNLVHALGKLLESKKNLEIQPSKMLAPFTNVFKGLMPFFEIEHVYEATTARIITLDFI